MSILKIKFRKTTKVYSIFKKLTTIGKDEANDVVIPDSLVADLHANIVYDGKNYNIRAVQGKNVIHINGRKKSKAVLNYGDNIKIGDAELEFIDKEEKEVEKEPSREDDYRKLFDISKRILDDYDLDRLLQNLMDAVVDITGADKGFLILLEGDRMEIKVARNLNKENIAQAVSQVSDSIISRVIRTKMPLIVSDALHHEEFANAQSVMALNLNSVMCVPLLDRGNLMGLIYVGNSNIKGLFVRHTLEMLTVFASLASLVVRNALLLNELQLDNRQLHEKLEQNKFGQIVGSCTGMQNIFKTIRKIAPTDVSVLITGETGTGKELIAREIHKRSNRGKGPFVAINMGAIPESILESELFGHVKGAFTGAIATRKGRFQEADGGTLFLDEIGELPVSLQVKILRALQEKMVVKIGDNKPEKVDIRILAATNRDLIEEVKVGNFREDLYYRVNVVNIHIPPLRDRGEDIVVIAKYLLNRFREEYETHKTGFSPDGIEAIMKYPWPGNIREMENRLKRAVVLSDKSLISAADLGIDSSSIPEIVPLTQAREDFTKKYILDVLDLNGGNRTKTAKDLGVDPRTIFRYLEKEPE
ncbi:sigma 54-interacting transcriptional regulator [Myxococcota bacterium]|nr:sigma 54-interacting transcriptional regulator [Myxococcota bacterium]MBU1380601.1 sigma 54-interacting transcriptional regulator [Myxococcota bacterium]MBU1497738.1 sigma 54-interacting transcriptional regulator [Myxococcota bacterium]